jgi:hypothetical protein
MKDRFCRNHEREQPSVWCECLFADPVADVAVLGAPDNQELSDQADAYEALVAAATPVAVAEPPSRPIPEEIARLALADRRRGRHRHRHRLYIGRTARRPSYRGRSEPAPDRQPAGLVSDNSGGNEEAEAKGKAEADAPHKAQSERRHDASAEVKAVSEPKKRRTLAEVSSLPVVCQFSLAARSQSARL